MGASTLAEYKGKLEKLKIDIYFDPSSGGDLPLIPATSVVLAHADKACFCVVKERLF